MPTSKSPVLRDQEVWPKTQGSRVQFPKTDPGISLSQDPCFLAVSQASRTLVSY